MTVENLLYTLAGASVGLVAGLALSVWWERTDNGDKVLRVRLSDRWQRMFFAAVGVMAVFSVALTAVKNNEDQRQTETLAEIIQLQQQQVARQAWCNQQLIDVIADNAEVAKADRANTDGLLNAIGEQVLNPDPDRERRVVLLQNAYRLYYDTKAANQAARQPYPAPDCGK